MATAIGTAGGGTAPTAAAVAGPSKQPAESGGDLREVLLTLLHRGDRHRSPTPPVVWRHDCGAVLTPVVACAHCGRPARGEQGSLTLESGPARA